MNREREEREARELEQQADVVGHYIMSSDDEQDEVAPSSHNLASRVSTPGAMRPSTVEKVCQDSVIAVEDTC